MRGEALRAHSDRSVASAYFLPSQDSGVLPIPFYPCPPARISGIVGDGFRRYHFLTLPGISLFPSRLPATSADPTPGHSCSTSPTATDLVKSRQGGDPHAVEIGLSANGVAVLRFEIKGGGRKTRKAGCRPTVNWPQPESWSRCRARRRITASPKMDQDSGRKSLPKPQTGSSVSVISRRTRAICRRQPGRCYGGSSRLPDHDRAAGARIPRAGDGPDHLSEAHVRTRGRIGLSLHVLGLETAVQILGGAVAEK